MNYKSYVVYHDGCNDGFGAAYAVWKTTDGSSDYSYVPMSYHKPLPIDKFEKKSRVIFVDCSPKLDQLKEMVQDFQVIIVDHHKTAAEMMEKFTAYFRFYKNYPSTFPKTHIDMTKSGAVLTWEFFSGMSSDKLKMPLLFKYIQDRDLWQHKLPFTREISAALFSFQKKFEVWDLIVDNPMMLVEKGKTLLEEQDRQVKRLVKGSFFRKLGKYNIPVVNTPEHGSDVANTLLKNHPAAPFAACYHDLSPTTRKWELRSNGGFDVSAFAKKRGGGGHLRAAGFVEFLGEKDGN